MPRIDVVTGFVTEHDDGDHVSIDSLAEQCGIPDLIKMGIERGEVAVLRGASGVLHGRRPAMQLEVHGRDIEWECSALMRDAGYYPPTVAGRRRWLPENRPLEHNR